MSKQSWMTAALLAIFVMAGFAAATSWRIRQHGRDTSLALATGTLIEPQRELAAFDLIDHRGKRFGPAELRGAWTVLYFGYTNCPDVCPLTLSTLAAVDKKLEQAGQPVPHVVFVGVDSRRDTPARVAQYVTYFDSRFLGVAAADQSTMDAFARQLGVAVIITPARDGTYTVDHTSALFITAPSGRLAAILTGPLTTDALAGDFQKLLASGG